MRELPVINGKYWLTLMAASIFGTNTGDFLSIYLKLGNLNGLPFLALALAAIFLVEKISPWRSVLFFWAAIIVIRTAATNIADANYVLGIFGAVTIAMLFLAFVLAVRRYQARSVGVEIGAGRVGVDGFYWVVMALAGIVGTLSGDLMSHGFGLVAAARAPRRGLLLPAGGLWFPRYLPD